MRAPVPVPVPVPVQVPVQVLVQVQVQVRVRVQVQVQVQVRVQVRVRVQVEGRHHRRTLPGKRTSIRCWQVSCSSVPHSFRLVSIQLPLTKFYMNSHKWNIPMWTQPCAGVGFCASSVLQGLACRAGCAAQHSAVDADAVGAALGGGPVLRFED